jgi:hypothetical protein
MDALAGTARRGVIMAHRALARRATEFAMLALVSHDSLLTETQHTLAALADIERRFEADRERLEPWAAVSVETQDLWSECKRYYQREREPHIRKLEQLERQMKAHLMCEPQRAERLRS